jgi:predicted Zn-ribbon and HTH transcriptional regulator
MGTLRQDLVDLLARAPMDLRELAEALGVRETEAAQHLEHAARSLKARGRALKTTPAYCRDCVYTFRKRTRFTRPGRCPRCKSNRIQGAIYALDD